MNQKGAQFIFPHDLSGLQEVVNPQAAKQTLYSLSLLQDLNRSSFRYRMSAQKGKYFYLKCRWRGCRSQLRFRIADQKGWKLTKADNHHEHMLPNCRRIQFSAVQQYLDEIDIPLNTATLKKIVCSRFAITEKQFYYLLTKRKGRTLSRDKLIQQLEESGYNVFVSQEAQDQSSPPQLFIAVNEEMKKLFQKYGDVVSFDFSFNLIKNVHQSGRKWKIGCFLGTSSCKKIVPLAIVASLFETKEVYVRIFRTFFEAMKGQPNVIVTDEQRAIHAAIIQLKQTGQYEGMHLHDAYHILHNIRKKLKQKQNIIFYSRLLHARNKLEYSKLLEIARESLKGQQQNSLEKFVAGSHMFCFSQIGPTFIGFTPSSSPNECFHSLIKRVQPCEKDFSLTIMNLVKYCDRLVKQCHNFELDKTAYQKIFGLAELEAVRMMLSKPILSKFMQELAKSLLLEEIDCEKDYVLIRENRSHFAVKRQESHWKCSCLYFQKVSLPCRHMLRIIVCRKDRLIDYLPQRWLATSSNQKISRPTLKRGRERNSSRKIFV